MKTIPKLIAGQRLSHERFNEVVHRLNTLSKVTSRGGIKAMMTSGGLVIWGEKSTSTTSTTTASGVREAVIAEAPAGKDNIKVNLVNENTGIEAASGDEYNVDCYADIAGGSRLDLAVPRLAQDLHTSVCQRFNSADGANRWYFTTLFNASRDFSFTG